MILNINDDEYLETPTADMVRAAIIDLPADQFAILSRADEDYVQTYHNADGTYELEFRAGSADEHYAVADQRLTAADVAAVFADYQAGRNDFKGDWRWEKVEFDADFAGDLTADNAYLLGGEELRKIAVGDEQHAVVDAEGKCPQCRANRGDFHRGACELEECPRCHDRLLHCDCQ